MNALAPTSVEKQDLNEETALVEAVTAGDVTAFAVLVERYDRQVFRIAKHVTQHAEDAQTLWPSLTALFVLCDVEGFSMKEAAETLDLSLSPVKSRLLRARLQLRENLNRYSKRPPTETR